MHEHKRSQRGKSHHFTYLQDDLQAPQSGENNEGMRMVDITSNQCYRSLGRRLMWSYERYKPTARLHQGFSRVSFCEASGTYIKSFCFKSIEAAKSTVQNESHSLLTTPKENGISLVALSSTMFYFDFALFSSYNFLCQ